jgi:uncharacterized repeat protein (TIGR03803 family)
MQNHAKLQNTRGICLKSMICATVVFFAAARARAQTYTILYNPTSSIDTYFGSEPPLALAGDSLYGIIAGTGPSQQGEIFQYDLSTGIESSVYTFSSANGDEGVASGSLLVSGSVLYGATGAQSFGKPQELFAYNLSTQTRTILDASWPGSQSLVQSGSTLFGYTGAGIIEYNLSTNQATVLPNSNPPDPIGNPIVSGTMLYGVSNTAGANQVGSIFAYDLTTDSLNTLYSFQNNNGDGQTPEGPLVLDGSTLYGAATAGGGAGNGAIFDFNLSTDTENILYSFKGPPNDAAFPWGSLILSGSTLFGASYDGGDQDSGAIYGYNLSTNQETTFFSFSQATGDYPLNTLTQSGNTLYGLTTQGGDNGVGTLFSLTVPEPATGALSIFALAALRLRRPRD